MSWEKTTLGEISECIQPGPFGSQLHSSDYSDFGVPIIMPKDMVEGKISHANMCYVSEEHQRRLARHQVFDGDLLVARKGDVRKCVYITEAENGCLTGSDCLKVSLNKEKCHPKYIYYQLRSAYIGRWLEQISIGATMPSLNTGLLSSIELNIPSMETQKKIADILSAYDDLIENNQKQIKLLEEAAQRLYKEWFVDLHFPGHEDVKIVDGVPEGWEKKRADSFFDITIGKTPPRSEQHLFTSGKKGIPWVSISDMGKSGIFIYNTNEKLTGEAINLCNVKVVPAGTILVSFKLTVGRVSIVSSDMATNEAIAHFCIKDDFCRAYTYCYLKNFEYDVLGNTSSISKAVNSKIIKAMPFVMPEKKIVEKFSMRVKPLFDGIKNKQRSISLLQEARDRLLPKLISGEIQV